MPDRSVPRGAAPRDEKTGNNGNSGVKRPLVPVVLALMLGLAAAAWGVKLPQAWLVAGLLGLLVAMAWLYVRPQSQRLPKGRKEQD